MSYSTKQIRYLRSLAHGLRPLVAMGKGGYSPQIVREVARSLADHELIKVRLDADDRGEFHTHAEQLAAETQAALVQTIGRIAVLYKPAAKPEIHLPKAL